MPDDIAPPTSVAPVLLLGDDPQFVAGRSASLSSRIIADVRRALGERRLKPGDTLGTEKDLAAQYDVSRIVARDALRSLQALGIVDIRMGKGGGARVARGNPRLFAEALAIQLDLTGIGAGEVIDAQRAIECMAAELAFHFAVAEASHNRVLVVQLVSLDHIAWPLRNTTLTPAVSRRVLDVHKELAALIEMRDPAGARRLMDDHMRMIRSRRVTERGKRPPPGTGCC
jgi:GntR family transcriptional regulator, transcriptional repressor for pyruvate dehydrogenase complex